MRERSQGTRIGALARVATESMPFPAASLFIILSLTNCTRRSSSFPLPWPRRMQQLVSGGLFKVTQFQFFPTSGQLTPECTENNLFLVKRLIQRIDMRNPDPGPKRYTSLAWAAVLGKEETFEYLLNAGHDDQELSRVRYFPASTCRAF